MDIHPQNIEKNYLIKINKLELLFEILFQKI